MEIKSNESKKDDSKLTESELANKKILEVIDLIPCKEFTTKSDFYKWLTEGE